MSFREWSLEGERFERCLEVNLRMATFLVGKKRVKGETFCDITQMNRLVKIATFSAMNQIRLCKEDLRRAYNRKYPKERLQESVGQLVEVDL